jgi:hypothetical protein
MNFSKITPLQKIAALAALLGILLLSACSQNPVNQTLVAQDFGTTDYDEARGVFANSTGVYVTGWTEGSLDGPNIRWWRGLGATVWY